MSQPAAAAKSETPSKLKVTEAAIVKGGITPGKGAAPEGGFEFYSWVI